MNSRALKPGLREQLGVAVNTSGLTLGREGQERALDRIAALGAASLSMRLGADREGVPIAGSMAVVYGTAPDPRDVITSDLVPLLWHIRYGGQLGSVQQAIELFAKWVAYRTTFAPWASEQHRAVRMAFASRAMHEWLSDRCTSCGGTGKHERSETGSWIRPRGSMQRNATFRPCSACQGSKRAAIRHPERMRAMGMDREQYETERWAQRFKAGVMWLDQLLPQRIVRALTRELERGKRQT